MGKRCWHDDGVRCWLEVVFECPARRDGCRRHVTMRPIADTGCIFPLIVSPQRLRQIRRGDRPDETSNYGTLTGGLVRAVMPELGFDQRLIAYANDAVARMVRKEGFDGIAGKPFLDLFHWSNGRGGEFCLTNWDCLRAAEK